MKKSQSDTNLFPPFDVWSDFEFYRRWKEKSAVKRVLQEKLKAKIAREKALQQRKEEARLMQQGWHRLSGELQRRGLPNLGSQRDLAHRLLKAMHAEEGPEGEGGDGTLKASASAPALL